MTRLVWDQTTERPFESGIDQGVLYFEDGNIGVCWNGLISVEENFRDTSTPIYKDGVKICDLTPLEDYSAILSAWTYPDQIDEMSFNDRFHISYRTFVSNDTSEVDKYYKIHILYNIVLTPQASQYESDDSEINPVAFKWNLTGVPEKVPGFRPTVHAIIDSRYFDPGLLADIENVIYGSVGNDPNLPKLNELAAYADTQAIVIITDNGDGTWSAMDTLYDKITMLDESTFQIVDVDATYLDADTYEVSTTY